MPDADEEQTAPEREPEDILARRAEGEANAKLARPLRHAQRHHAVEPDARQDEGESGEGAEQRHR